MKDLSKIDYSKMDRPEIIAFLFHPRTGRGFVDPPENTTEILIPVEEGIKIGACFHYADKNAPRIKKTDPRRAKNRESAAARLSPSLSDTIPNPLKRKRFRTASEIKSVGAIVVPPKQLWPRIPCPSNLTFRIFVL